MFNFEYTKTLIDTYPSTFYNFTSTAFGATKNGVGINIGDSFGVSAYYSTDLSVGVQLQIGSLHAGLSIGFDGIGFNFGADIGDHSIDFSVSISIPTLIAVAALVTSPVPGSRILAGLMLIIDFFR